jgi:hypothetical protein
MKRKKRLRVYGVRHGGGEDGGGQGVRREEAYGRPWRYEGEA